LLTSDVNFTTYFFPHDKLPINMKILFFLAKCVRTTVKIMVVDRKKPKSTSSAIFGVETLRKAVNSSGVLTEFATEPTRQI